jgi:phosphatidyl-myo-inositol dimannoside synthase
MDNNKGNILFLTIDFPPMPGGMARHSYDAALSFAALGEKAVVIAPSVGRETEAPLPGLSVLRLKTVRYGYIFDNYLMSVLSFYFCSIRCRLRGRVRLVAANTWSIAGVAALLLKKTVGIPYIVFAHGLDIKAPLGSAVATKLMKAVLNNASCVIANSRFTKTLVEQVVGHARIRVINPIVDLARLSINERGADTCEERKNPVILTVGRLVESKNHEAVIKAFIKVLAKFPGAIYRIVGSGPMEKDIRRIIRGFGLENNIELYTDVDDAGLGRHYNSCDIFILTSKEVKRRGEVEGFGITFLEAGAYGKPVIGSHTGGIPDAVIDQVTGFLVDPLDTDNIADALTRLLSDAALRQTLGENGRRRVTEDLNPKNFAERIGDVIGNLS